MTAAGVYTFDGIHMVTQAARRLKERIRASAYLLDPRGTRTQRRLTNAVMGGLICNNVLPTSGSKTRFKGRRAYHVGIFAPPFLQPSFCPFWTNGNYSQREVAAAQDITIAKASVVYNGVVVPVTYKGARSFTIPAGATEFQCDPIFPNDFGVASFTARSIVEYRHYFDLASGQSAPYCDYSTDLNLSWRGVPSDLPDDIDATGAMTATGSPDSLNIFFPSMMVSALGGAYASLGFFGDSIFRQQNDTGGLGRLGGGYHKRAAYAEGLPFMSMGVGGRTAEQTANSPKILALLEAGRFTDIHIGLGTNELVGTRPIADIISDNRIIWASARKGGVRTIIQSNIQPRTVDNAWKCTDLANQVPVAGFEAGGRRDQFNTALQGQVGVNGGPDVLFDFASICSEPSSPSLWKVSTYNGTLTSAVAIGATTIQTDTPPIANDNLVFEPGNSSNVDIGGQGGPRVAFVSGSASPYTASFVPASGISPWTGAADGAFGTPGKAHAAGTSVKVTLGTDGTHPAMAAHIKGADTLRPVYRGLAR
ncbi:SGNH/GDSL hydrolase family protein [Aureimonas sp. AU40]|uniref:SGNH/GDSL hydrolase family protein n=1 Tax=Aureimonas sp. AU40 TaxID=1637747 RepID=UPI000780453C|nr:SGNH/GDSL hydrolase family protein [Aureimonas sp. AU40]